MKAFDIAWKDLLIRFRDPGALALLLVTPFALTLTIAFAFGGLGSSGGGGLADIPVIIINQDTGEFGAYLVQAFASDELAELVEPVVLSDTVAARAAVDADETAAVIIIPAGFSASLMAVGQGTEAEPSVIEIYANPARPISVGVVRGIVAEFLSRLTGAITGVRVSVVQVMRDGLASPQEIQVLAGPIGERAWQQVSASRLVAVRSESTAQSSNGGFDWATYMAPSMAIVFLMFTVTAGGRSVLAEREGGTLARLLVSPTTATQILAGKMLGIFLSGVVQVTILIVASSLLLGLRWGAPALVALMVLALVAAATGWGTLLAAYARTPGQANAIGTMLTLAFGALAGNFLPRQWLPGWVRTLSYISPNAWGLEAFDALISGGNLADLAVPLIALPVMALVLFAASLPAFRRQFK